MKNTTRIAIITIIIVLSFAAAFLLLAPAKTFINNGVKYKVLTESEAAGTAEVIANGYSGAVTIPETVNNGGVTYTVTSIGASAFYNCLSLTGISMPGSVTSIGDSAFSGCVRLTNISIPGSVTSIGASAFSVSSLTSVSIPAGVTSIQSDAFSSCINLISIVFKGTAPPAFSNSLFKEVPAGLEAAVPRDAVSAYVTALSGKLPAESQINMSVDLAAVSGITAPVRSAVPAAVIETEQYTGTIVWIPAASTFEGSTSYTAAITLTPKAGFTFTGVPADFFTVAGASSVSSAADSGVITAVFPATAPQAVADIRSVSGVSPPVRSAVPASAITETEQYTGTILWTPDNDTFTGNTVYTATITLAQKPGYTFTGVPANFFTVAGADSVTSAADSGVITAMFPVTATEAGDTITASGVNYKVLTKSGAAGTVEVTAGSYSGAVAIPETADYSGITYTVVSIGTKAFKDCSGLSSISLPGSVTSIGNYAFQGCRGLTSISLPGSVASIGEGAFFDCSRLISIRLPRSITSIWEGAFYNCSSLTGITIPADITSIANYTFYDCSSLKKISLPAGVTSIGDYAFSNCYNLTSITIPGSAVSIGDRAFFYCSGLSSVSIPDSVASIGNYAFSYCDHLTSITIPGSAVSIGDYAFCSCSSLKNVSILGDVTIGYSAFAYCCILLNVSILGDAIIGDSAFAK